MDKPSMARMYDYYLGGTHHREVDRLAGDRMLAAIPTMRDIARANRAFLGRAVRHLAGLGVRQFLDVGSGIPTAGNVHEIVAREAPGGHVLYVDLDADAVAYSNEILHDNDDAAAIQADLASPRDILDHPERERLIDLDRPVALLMMSMLQFLPDETVVPAVATLRDALPSGSCLALSHPNVEGVRDDPSGHVSTVYRGTNAATTTPRTRAEISNLFGDFMLLDPGLTWVTHWRPDNDPGPADPDAIPMVAGVGRRP